MTRSLKVNADVHREAKTKAAQAGMFLQDFVERALQAFNPKPQRLPPRSPKRPTNKAG